MGVLCHFGLRASKAEQFGGVYLLEREIPMCVLRRRITSDSGPAGLYA
jgi:hypothetical protein